MTSGQIRRALQRFRDYAGDVVSSDFDTFTDRLKLMVHFVQTDVVVEQVHRQILDVPCPSFDAWYAENDARRSGLGGTASLTFPTDVDQRLSLMYQVLLRLGSGQLDYVDFGVSFFGGDGKLAAYQRAIIDAIFRPLFREVGYRLDDVLAALPAGADTTVPSSVIQVIHNTGSLVQQIATGTGNTQLASSRSEASADLCTAIDSLRDQIRQLSEDHDQRHDALQIADAMHEEASSSQPRTTVLKGLLSALPSISQIVSIANTIRQMLGA
jgi:hypothetical protein